MTYAFIKAGAAAFALGGFVFAGPAQAVSPLPLNDAAPLVMPVADEENEAVEEDLRSEIFPPGSKEGTEPKEPAPEQPKGEGSSDVEQKELQEDGLEPK